MDIGAFFRGMATTFREMFNKPVTVQYPEVKRPVSATLQGQAYPQTV